MAWQAHKKKLLRLSQPVIAALLFVGCSGPDTPEPKKAQSYGRPPVVAVFNGSGAQGVAKQVAKRLRHAGFDVGNGNGENSTAFEFSYTLVVDVSGRKGDAEAVAEFLDVPCIVQRSANTDNFANIHLIVGADIDMKLRQAKDIRGVGN